MSASPRDWQFPFCPSPPEWRVDWDSIAAQFHWIREMAGVPQDAVHHAEGDVSVHTRMVAEALSRMEAWRELAPTERTLLFAAALLHDVAKPATTVIDAAGRIHSPGHARRGEAQTRSLLWLGEGLSSPPPFAVREQIAKLVRHHGLPLWFLEREFPERAVYEASLNVRLDRVALLAEADARGRECADRQELLDRITLFRTFCQEADCYERPRAFAIAQSRVAYFRADPPRPQYEAFDETRFEVVLMAGLPGAGKDTWIARHLPGLPIISLDTLRRTMKIKPEEPQERVIQAAKEQARVYLRTEQPFVWNATNVTRQIRRSLCDLFTDYGARVRLVYLDAPCEVLLRRNRERPAAVPEPVIFHLMERLEMPDLTEAYQVEWFENV